MDRRTRVLHAIRRRQPDRTPKGELCLDDRLVADLLEVPRVRFAERLRLAERLDLDLVCLPTVYPPAAHTAALPDPAEVSWTDLTRWAVESDRCVFVLLDGVFTWGVRVWGFERFVVALARGSEGLSEFGRTVAALNADLVRRAAGGGAAGIVVGDDVAFQSGPLVPPAALREHLWPLLAQQAVQCRALGLPLFLHADGNLDALLADIAATGIDGLQGLEAAAGMDLAAVKRDFGRHLCLWGNLDPAGLVRETPPGDVAAAAGAVMAAGAPGGGFIFGTSSGLFKGMRPAQVIEAYRAAATCDPLRPAAR